MPTKAKAKQEVSVQTKIALIVMALAAIFTSSVFLVITAQGLASLSQQLATQNLL